MLNPIIEIQRPVLRYFGGKWRQKEWIARRLPPHVMYVEPFGGAASILMCKPQARTEVYNDIDAEIVNVFQVLRDAGLAADLKQQLALTPYASGEYKAAAEKTDDPVEQARRTIVRSFMGYGSNSIHKSSGFRSSRSDSKFSPATEWSTYIDSLPVFTARLREVIIECDLASKVIDIHDHPDALFYVDPPYVHSTRGRRDRYAHELTDDDHRSLANQLRSCAGMVVLSGYRCDLYDELYRDFRRVDKSSRAFGGRHRVESLWFSRRAWKATAQGELFKAQLQEEQDQ